jgi:predicted CXXCH cytochrome family protein
MNIIRIVTLALLGTVSAATAQTRAARSSCDMCHGELEFLRQNTESLVRARAALVPDSVLNNTAHGKMQCAECHTGLGRFPHSKQATTRTCASCHETADTAYRRGAHVQTEHSEGATCAQCHGVHRMTSKADLATRRGIAGMNSTCIGCHETERLHAGSPHADSTLCSGCHGSHNVQRKDARTSTLWPGTQLETCGTCHDSIASIWKQRDVHFRALTGTPKEKMNTRPPACTSCHGAHGINTSPDSVLASAAVTRCGECHKDARRAFLNSYHGRATNLGSEASATCAECHGSHDILPASDSASMIAQGNLEKTCGECHEHARPGFVKYDVHPDPLNPKRNPYIFATFVFMNALLGMTLLVFGAHTFFWWLRLYIDRKRGVVHGHGAEQ